MENFANFYKGDRKIFNLMDKIRGRMNGDLSCMDNKEYYPDDLEKIKINYHIIHIDDTRKSNRSKIDLILNSNKLPIESLNAREEANIEKFLKNNKEFKINWDGFKKGELGNFGSHFLAWKYLLNSNLKNLLVFEDDAIIHEDFIDKYGLIIKNLPHDYDVMSVYVDPNQYDRMHQSDYVNEYISKGYQDWSTLCYIVSRQGAQKLINYVTTIGMDYPTDWFIFRRGHQGIYNVYTLPPTFQSPLEIDKQYESQVQ
jgi:GR25 family glycosyltransferase involved in LPS biosynthesis